VTPRFLLRTAAGGILRDSIHRWNPASGEWASSGGYSDSRLKGLGGDSDDPDEIDADDGPAVMAALTGGTGRKDRDAAALDRRLRSEAPLE